MAKIIFRLLGTALGLFGVVTLCVGVYVLLVGDIPEVTDNSAAWSAAAVVVTVFGIIFLIACGTATWWFPRRAPQFAWAAAYVYFVPGVLLAKILHTGLMDTFYYAAAARFAAAWAMSMLSKQLIDAD